MNCYIEVKITPAKHANVPTTTSLVILSCNQMMVIGTTNRGAVEFKITTVAGVLYLSAVVNVSVEAPSKVLDQGAGETKKQCRSERQHLT